MSLPHDSDDARQRYVAIHLEVKDALSRWAEHKQHRSLARKPTNLVRPLSEDDQAVVGMLLRQLDSTAISGEDGLFELGPKGTEARAFFFRTGDGTWFLAAADDKRGRSSAALPRAIKRLADVRDSIKCSRGWEQSLHQLDPTWDILPVDPRRK